MKTAILLSLVWIVTTAVVGNLYLDQVISMKVEENYPGWGPVIATIVSLPSLAIVMGWSVYLRRWLIRTADEIEPYK